MSSQPRPFAPCYPLIPLLLHSHSLGSTMSSARLPNILVTGTPGSGKTSFCSLVLSRLSVPLRPLDVTALARTHGCSEEYNADFDTQMLDEDKLLDVMEEIMFGQGDQKGGFLVDYHSCDFFPERYFDLVLVLTVQTEVLYDRLEGRGELRP